MASIPFIDPCHVLAKITSLSDTTAEIVNDIRSYYAVPDGAQSQGIVSNDATSCVFQMYMRDSLHQVDHGIIIHVLRAILRLFHGYCHHVICHIVQYSALLIPPCVCRA